MERHPAVMHNAVARHDKLLQAAVVKNRGYVVKMRGDGLHAVFAAVKDAVAAAVAGQLALQTEAWDGNLRQMPVRYLFSPAVLLNCVMVIILARQLTAQPAYRTPATEGKFYSHRCPQA